MSAKRSTGCSCLIVLGFIAGCGGSTTVGDAVAGGSVAGGGGHDEGGNVGELGGNSAGGGNGGAAFADAAPVDGHVGEPAPEADPCIPLAGSATDVYVDKRNTASSPTGAAGCGFKTILEGIAAVANVPGMRTVHVAGDTPPLVYEEVAAVEVKTAVTLRGDGPSKTTISASGQKCTDQDPISQGICAVIVNDGATLDGFTVVSPLGSGIVTPYTTATAPVVKNVAAIGSGGVGIETFGPVDLGPNIVANKNGFAGLYSFGNTVLVHVMTDANSVNTFDENREDGLFILARLQFDGGRAVGNGKHGVEIGGHIGSPAQSITGLVASNNKQHGIFVRDGQSLKLRSSKLFMNAIGLEYRYAVQSVLDLGTATDPGGNTFGGASAATRNSSAGISLCCGPIAAMYCGTGVGAAGGVQAGGNSFAACPLVQTAVDTCDGSPGVYSDVIYTTVSPGAPLVASTCAVGP